MGILKFHKLDNVNIVGNFVLDKVKNGGDEDGGKDRIDRDFFFVPDFQEQLMEQCIDDDQLVFYTFSEEENPESENTDVRITSLIGSLKTSVYEYICRSLFK
eukprot:g45933.t1